MDSRTVDWGDLDDAPLRGALSSWRFFENTLPSERADRLQNAQVLVTNKVLVDAELLAGLPTLSLICIAATGTNNVDLVAARAKGISVCNVQNYATPSVVQHTFGLLLQLAGHIQDYNCKVKGGAWSKSPYFCLMDYPMIELAGKTLGIVGYGALGQGVAALARGLGMEVVVAARNSADRRPDRLPLSQVLQRSDVLSLHCPLTPETKGLIGQAELVQMRPGSLILNTARGGIIDEQALADALRSGHLGGAALDVLTVEPPDAQQPLLSADIPNLIVTPHVAWASKAARQRLLNQIAQNIEHFYQGNPKQVVN